MLFFLSCLFVAESPLGSVAARAGTTNYPSSARTAILRLLRTGSPARVAVDDTEASGPDFNPVEADKIPPVRLESVYDDTYVDEAIPLPASAVVPAGDGKQEVLPQAGDPSASLLRTGSAVKVDAAKVPKKGGFLTAARESAQGSRVIDEYDVDLDAATEASGLDPSKGEALTRETVLRAHKKLGVHKIYSEKDRAYMRNLRRKLRESSTASSSSSTSAATALSAVNHVSTIRGPLPKKSEIAADRQKTQCLQHAAFLKANHVRGTKLVAEWRSTCAPAANAAPDKADYRGMCESLVAAVTPFAADFNWNEGRLCTAVLGAFNAMKAA